MTGYELSRTWFDWASENTEKHSPAHAALFFWIIELWNRLGQKNKFGFPTMDAMEVLNIRSRKTYYKVFHDLENWGLIEVVIRSKNANSANIISISACVKNTQLNTQAIPRQGDGRYPSGGNIDKLLNNKTNKEIPPYQEFEIYALSKELSLDRKGLKLKYESWVENGWKDGNDKKIKNWKSKLLNTIQYLPRNQKVTFK